MDCHALLQRVFPTHGLNPHLLHWQPDSLPLNHQVSEILGMSTDEKNLMFDLAGAARDYIDPDLCDYIMNRSYVAAALRVARDLDAGEEDWKLIMNILEKQREE